MNPHAHMSQAVAADRDERRRIREFYLPKADDPYYRRIWWLGVPL